MKGRWEKRTCKGVGPHWPRLPERSGERDRKMDFIKTLSTWLLRRFCISLRVKLEKATLKQ